MTLFAPTTGQRKVYSAYLTTTNVTTIATSSQNGKLTLDSINIACDTAGSTLSIWYNDGTTDYYLMHTEAIAANTRVLISNHHVPLGDGWTLKAQAGTANKIHVSAVMIQSNPTQQQTNALIGS